MTVSKEALLASQRAHGFGTPRPAGGGDGSDVPSRRRSFTDPLFAYIGWQRRPLKKDKDLVERAPSRIFTGMLVKGSNLPALAFTINAVLGAGVVAIPYAFAQVGLLAAAGLLGFITCVSALGMRWIVEAGARADELSLWAGEAASPKIGQSEPYSAFEWRTQRSVPELCGFYGGRLGLLAAQVNMVVYGVFGMFLYVAVFAETLAGALPIFPADGEQCNYSQPLLDLPTGCRYNYWFWLGIFALFQGFLAKRNLSEQATLQVTLTLCGLMAVLLMVSTITIGSLNESYNDCYQPLREEVVPEPMLHTCPVPLVFRLAGFAFAVSSLSTAQMAQFGTPVLTASCSDTRKAPRVFQQALLSTFILYSVYGCFGASYFGFDGVEPLITMKWRGTDLPWSYTLGIGMSKVIGWFVTIYPAVSVSAAFPINCVSTGNSLLWTWCDYEIVDKASGKARVVSGPRSPATWFMWVFPCFSQNFVRHQGSLVDSSGRRSVLPEGALVLSAKRMQYLMRATVMLPAFGAAAFTSDLGKILEIGALAGFLFAFVVPPLLQIVSRRRCERELPGGLWRTPYSAGWGSEYPACIACMAFGGVAVSVWVYGLLYELAI